MLHLACMTACFNEESLVDALRASLTIDDFVTMKMMTKMMKISKKLTFDLTIQFRSVTAHFDWETMTKILRMTLMIGNDDINKNDENTN